MPGSVIEENGWERSLALGAEEQCAKFEVPAWYDHRFRSASQTDRLRISRESEPQRDY
jgi:hypothetical protein